MNTLWGELFRKGQEVQRDFANLSVENKKRVYEELGKYIPVESLLTFLQNMNR